MAADAARAQLLAAVSERARTFGDCAPERFVGTTLSQRWSELRTSMKAATVAGAPLPAALAGAVESATAADDERSTVRDHLGEGRALMPPDLIRPVYEKPAYSGAWFLSGSYRANYTSPSGEIEGVVVTKGDRYFVVLGAAPAGGYVDYLSGYVEDSGRAITLDVGRSGRDADVVTLTDKESYRDDQETYSSQVAEAKAKYDRELATYKESARSQAAARKSLAATLAALEAEHARLEPLFYDTLRIASKRVIVEFFEVDCGASANTVAPAAIRADTAPRGQVRATATPAGLAGQRPEAGGAPQQATVKPAPVPATPSARPAAAVVKPTEARAVAAKPGPAPADVPADVPAAEPVAVAPDVPADQPGRLVVEGDATSVSVRGGGGTFSPGELGVGRYTASVTFADGTTVLQFLEIGAGAVTRMKCSSKFQSCRVIRE